MAKIKSVYVCQNCGAESPKWIGKCAACGEWNTYTEEIIREEKTSKIATILGETAKQKPQPLLKIAVIWSGGRLFWGLFVFGDG